jgi:hypothetical protein
MRDPVASIPVTAGLCRISTANGWGDVHPSRRRFKSCLAARRIQHLQIFDKTPTSLLGHFVVFLAVLRR